jgi:hypothetical protein
MKQVTVNLLITMLLAICLISGCKKETGGSGIFSGNNKASLTEEYKAPSAVAVQNSTTKCIICDSSDKVYNLVDTLKTFKFKEGPNIVRSFDNGLKLIAQVKGGKIAQYVLQDKAGKQYLPKSIQKTDQQIKYRLGIGVIVIHCYCIFNFCICNIDIVSI